MRRVLSSRLSCGDCNQPDQRRKGWGCQEGALNKAGTCPQCGGLVHSVVDFECCFSGLLGLPCKVPQPQWLKQGKWMVSQFWRLEPEVAVSAGFCSFRGWGGRVCSRPLSWLLVASGIPWFADGVCRVCSRCLSSVPVLSLCLSFPFL